MNKKHLRTLAAMVLFGEVQVYHRPHPHKETDKGAVVSVKKWLERNGVKA